MIHSRVGKGWLTEVAELTHRIGSAVVGTKDVAAVNSTLPTSPVGLASIRVLPEAPFHDRGTRPSSYRLYLRASANVPILEADSISTRPSGAVPMVSR